jgi:hypothetical protein
MPLRKGKTWRYLMKDAAEVMQVECVEPRSVGGVDGWLVGGPGGESVFAWDGCILRTSRMGGIDFDPPLGILQADQDDAEWKYSGIATIRGTRQKITAELNQKKASIEGKHPDARRSTITFRVGANTIELNTVFAKDIGIVEQEQRNNGRTVSRAQLTNDSG